MIQRQAGDTQGPQHAPAAHRQHYGEFVGTGAIDSDPSTWSDLFELLVEAWSDLNQPGEQCLLAPGTSRDGTEGRYLLRTYAEPLTAMGEARFNHDDLIGLSNEAVFYYFPYIARRLWEVEEYPFYLMPHVRRGVPVFAEERKQAVHRWRFLLLACVIRIAIRRFLAFGQPDVAIRWEEFLERVAGFSEPDWDIATDSVTVDLNPVADRAVLLWKRVFRSRRFTYCYLLTSEDDVDQSAGDSWIPQSIETLCDGWHRLRLVFAFNGNDDTTVSWRGDRVVVLMAPGSEQVTRVARKSVFGVETLFEVGQVTS